MESTFRMPATRSDLFRVVRGGRNRWRLKVALRGLAILIGVGVVAMLAAAWGMEYFRFSAAAVSVLRILAYLVIAVTLVRALIIPLVRPLPDEQIALYLEEHEPSLD